MGKWKKHYIVINAIIVVILFIINIICAFNVSQRFIVDVIKTILVLYIALLFIGYFVIEVILTMKRGIRNIKKFDDELFKKIDQYKSCWKEDECYYKKQIQIINLYYKESGKVDELVKNNEIERLYARADFLSVQNSLYDNLTTCLVSLAISVVASFVCQMMECRSILLMLTWMVAIVFAFFGIVLLKYAEKGQAGSYRYYVDIYERDLLLQKITELEKKLTITNNDEQFLETKQIVINELIRIRQKKILKKQKESLETDIKRVEQLDLCLGDYIEFHIQKIYINGKDGYLVYDLEKGKENNYMGEFNLINQEYSLLYQILNKYELISFCKS